MKGNSVSKEVWLEDKQVTVGQFQVDFKKTRLYNNDTSIDNESKVIKLEPLTMELLCYLIKRHGHYVSQKELLDNVWDGRIVSDNAIRRVVKKLRDALGDDVKSPTYIKTVPSKGYLLIAEVSVEVVTQGHSLDHTSEQSELSSNKNINKKPKKTLKHLFFILIIFLICFAIYSFFPFKTELMVKQVQAVTTMSGEEDWADYHQQSDMVVYSHRKDTSGVFDLYIKSLSTNVTKRLTAGEANNYSAQFSKDGKKIALQRQKGNQAELVILYLNDTMDVSREEVIYQYDTLQPNLSWSPDDNALYFSLKKQSDYPNTIFKIDINTKRLTQVTYPDFNPHGDYFSALSPNGEHLGVLRYSSYQRAHLIILELESGKVQSNTVLDFIPWNMVWDESSSGVYLSNGNNIHFFDSNKDHLELHTQTKFDLYSIYSTCGKNCLLVGKEEKNARDIIEIKNPFITEKTYNLFEFSLAGKEGHPDYLADPSQVVFRYEYENKPQIVTYSTTGEMEPLTEFTQHHNISNLEYHHKSQSLLGILDNQLFTLDIKSKKIRYLTTQLEVIKNPSWSNDGRSIYFSRKESNQFWLIRHDLYNNQSEQALLPKVISAKEDALGENLYYQHADGQLFRAPISKPQNGTPIAKLQPASNISWHITSQYVYYSIANGYQYDLVRTDLESGETERAPLLKHALYAKFQLHPNEQKLLLLQRAAPSSDLYNIYF